MKRIKLAAILVLSFALGSGLMVAAQPVGAMTTKLSTCVNGICVLRSKTEITCDPAEGWNCAFSADGNSCRSTHCS